MKQTDMSNNWSYPGARWWKFDFHTHTPASTDTKAWQRAIGTTDELTPETWLLKCMVAGIDCVAVTDHNSGAWVDRLKAAYATMKNQPPAGFRALHIFPGVEISVNGGFHLLAIFDVTATGSDIDTLLGRVDYAGTKGDSDGVTRMAAAEVVQAVLDAGALPIPAHVESSKGLLRPEAAGSNKTALDHHTLKQILENTGILAMEVVDPTVAKPTAYTQAKLNWSEVIGSDCHSFQGENVPGSRYTWIKMAAPCLEGLRLSLLDGRDVSVRRSDAADTFSPFIRPEHFIESIEVVDAHYMGRNSRPAALKLNPFFNAVIGGRGTGKSTLVHALRLAYRRDRELDAASEAGETFGRFIKVSRNHSDPGGLLANTHITVTLSRDGVRHRLTWQQNGQGPVIEEWQDSPAQWKVSTSQSVTAQRFPVRLFSQGQIAALASESQQTLLQVIDEAAQTQGAQASLAEAKRSFLATRAKLRELGGKLQGREALNLSLADVQRKLMRFEAAHHADVLKAYQRTSRQTREMERQFESVAEMAASIQAIAVNLESEDAPDLLFDAVTDAQAVTFVGQLAEAVATAKTQLEAAAQLLLGAGSTLREQLLQSDWQKQIDLAKSAYEALKADLLAQGVSDPSEYGRLVQERQHLDIESQRLYGLQKQSEDLKQQAKAQLEQVWLARRGVSEVRKNFLQQTLQDNRFVRINLVPYSRDARVIERSLRDVLGAPDKFKDDIYVEPQGDTAAKGLIADLLLGADLIEAPGQPDTSAFENGLKKLQSRLVSACQGSGNLGGWFNKYLAAEAEKHPELVDHIRCWSPEDGLEVAYSRKGDGRDFQSIGQASAGQRAAAMLAFLLAHGSEPLVLDQPEDDLDNHLIYDLVVQQIRANKQRRQLIIVTHNPNIVVNGDAELIYALDFNHQCFVARSGSLQDKGMRDEICKIMEGGKDAFERRYQRLGRRD
jgi:PHP family Zn ribbon phosphoesterase